MHAKKRAVKRITAGFTSVNRCGSGDNAMGGALRSGEMRKSFVFFAISRLAYELRRKQAALVCDIPGRLLATLLMGTERFSIDPSPHSP